MAVRNHLTIGHFGLYLDNWKEVSVVVELGAQYENPNAGHLKSFAS